MNSLFNGRHLLANKRRLFPILFTIVIIVAFTLFFFQQYNAPSDPSAASISNIRAPRGHHPRLDSNSIQSASNPKRKKPKKKKQTMSDSSDPSQDQLQKEKDPIIEEQEEDIAPTQDLKDPPVFIFYYPWYKTAEGDGEYRQWNHKILEHWNSQIASQYPSGRLDASKGNIGTNFFPDLGIYSSKDESVIDTHMQNIVDAGANVLVVSWWGPSRRDPSINAKFHRTYASGEGAETDSAMPLILGAAARYRLKVAIHWEPYHGGKDLSVTELQADLEYIRDEYGDHPAMLLSSRTDGQQKMPWFFIYDSYLVPAPTWRQLMKTIHGTDLDGIFIGLVVEQKHVSELKAVGFDGGYTYFAADGFTFGSTSSTWGHVAQQCAKEGLIFIPSVGPGYDDTRIRPWNPSARRNREAGGYYDRLMRAALDAMLPLFTSSSSASDHSVPPAALSITSFNEWGEGTQIEPVRSDGYIGEDGFAYESYPNGNSRFYLERTKKWTDEYKEKVLSHKS